MSSSTGGIEFPITTTRRYGKVGLWVRIPGADGSTYAQNICDVPNTLADNPDFQHAVAAALYCGMMLQRARQDAAVRILAGVLASPSPVSWAGGHEKEKAK